MKSLKLVLSIGLLLLGFTIQSFAQVLLPEIKIVPARYKYLNAMDNTELAQPVRLLQEKVATYNVKDSEFYDDEYDTYFVSFYIPDGTILASYDKNGTLLRTAENYKNIKMPAAVNKAIATKYPQWQISKNVYLVNYYDSGVANKMYKILLENGDKRVRVKINEQGEFK